MKLIAMTAALAFSTAAFAQTTPAPTNTPPTQSMQPGPDSATTPTAPAPADAPMQDGTTPPPASEPMAAPAPEPAPMQGDTTMQQPTASGGGTMTAGGYMPATPPMSGARQPGAQVQVMPSMSPAQAFPAPAPKAEYPVCKRGQTDGCRNRGE